MPNTNHITDLMLGSDAQQVSTILIKARTEDVALIKQVFPEAGLQTYLAGHFLKKLADKLRAEGVSNAFDRVTSSEFRTIQDLIDHVQIRKPTSSRRRPNRSTSTE